MEAESAEGPGQESPAEAAARQRKAEMAAARRAAILAQMSAQQKSFIKEHAKLFQETGSSISGFFPPISLPVFSLYNFMFQRVVAPRQLRILVQL
jgi:hypothetical protein